MTINKLKVGLRVLYNYLQLRYLNTRYGGNLNPYAGTVIVDLGDLRLGNYYYALVRNFHEGGFNVIIRDNLRFIGGCFGNDAHIFSLERVKISGKLPDINAASKFHYIYDHKVNPLSRKWKKSIRIDLDAYSRRDSADAAVVTPFSMNPKLYIAESHKQAVSLRSSKKEMRVFFSGNQDKKTYDNPVFKKFFHKLNRIEIIDTLLAGLETEEVLVVDSDNSSAEGSCENKFVLARWEWSPASATNLQVRVNNDDWLTSLARSHFFLAAPGIRMPLCHNMVEAMSVGAIPITEYGEMFSPPLEHMKNCVAFKGSEDLLEKVRMVLNMKPEQIKQLKSGVEEYFDQYLALGKLPEMIEKIPAESLTLYMYAGEASYQEHLKNGKRSRFA